MVSSPNQSDIACPLSQLEHKKESLLSSSLLFCQAAPSEPTNHYLSSWVHAFSVDQYVLLGLGKLNCTSDFRPNQT